ncbi:acetyl-CoA carboxylase biotin carboxyl carrier protein [Helicobacter himalayensis]|uniref:acetyl-CoA carboxylase biotin carboxyl carrier protein n=1 Tax=Helicobacter himalayensis TaxID=1591088 RepID=UPI003D6DD528
MNLQEIKKLMELFSSSEIAKLNLKNGEFEIKLEKYGTSIVASAPVASAPVVSTPQIMQNTESTQTQSALVASAPSANGDFITSPMVGTFYRSPSPGAAPYVNVGDTIKKGQTIGIIEAMKIMNEIEAECDCKILAIEVDDATPVEFSTNLVRIQKL